MTKKTNKGQKEEGKIIHLSRPETEAPPEFYVNQARITFSVYDVAFGFGLMPSPDNLDEGPETTVTIRMSPQHAKVFAKLLMKNLTKYEKDIGEIPIHSKIYSDLGIE